MMERVRDAGQIAVAVLLWLAIFLGIAALSALTGCSSWQDTSRRTLHSVGRIAALAPPMVRQRCRAEALACKARSVSCRGVDDAGCARLCPAVPKCHTVELEAARANLATQYAVERGLAVVELADKPSTAKVLAEAVKALQALRRVLGAYGLELP